MVIQVKRDLKIIRDSVLEFFAKIEDVLGSVLLFPASGHPLLKLPFAFGEQIGGISPGKDRFVGARTRNTKRKRRN